MRLRSGNPNPERPAGSPGAFKSKDPRRWLHGRPSRRLCIPDILRRIGDEKLPAELQKKAPTDIRDSATMLEALMRVVYRRALAGEGWAVEFIAQRTEGKVPDKVQLSAGERPMLEMSDAELEEIAAGVEVLEIEGEVISEDVAPTGLPAPAEVLPDVPQAAMDAVQAPSSAKSCTEPLELNFGGVSGHGVAHSTQ